MDTDGKMVNLVRPIFSGKVSGAAFSPCDRYRYVLWRRWDFNQPFVLFIGLNPSTADSTVDDPTIRRCIRFAQSWGYGGMVMANLFAYRATDPRQLRQAPEPVGAETDHWLTALSHTAAQEHLNAKATKRVNAISNKVVAMWGNAGNWLKRDRIVLGLIRKAVPQLYCFATTKQGQPRHPLYLPKTSRPQPYSNIHVCCQP